jgi:hypothetical protein
MSGLVLICLLVAAFLFGSECNRQGGLKWLALMVVTMLAFGLTGCASLPTTVCPRSDGFFLEFHMGAPERPAQLCRPPVRHQVRR